MKRTLAIGCVATTCVLSWGCDSRPPVRGPAAPTAITAEAAARERAETDALLAEVVWPTCPADLPGQCGLYIDTMSHELVAAIVRDICHEDLRNEISEDCQRKLVSDFLETIEQRYTRAKREDVQARCDDGRTKCSSLAELEIAYLETHNDAVYASVRALQTDLLARQDQERQAAQKERAARDAEVAKENRTARDGARAPAAGLQGWNGGIRQSQGAPGCCAAHGGVAGCTNGRFACNDGTLSPSCRCGT